MNKAPIAGAIGVAALAIMVAGAIREARAYRAYVLETDDEYDEYDIDAMTQEERVMYLQRLQQDRERLIAAGVDPDDLEEIL